MKLKYYLRGIGIGIIVTFLILYFAKDSKTYMTDDEVKARAKELGMIENVTLSNSASKNSNASDNLVLNSQDKSKASSDNSALPIANVNDKKPTGTDITSGSSNETASSNKVVSNNKAASDNKAASENKTSSDSKTNNTSSNTNDKTDDKSSDKTNEKTESTENSKPANETENSDNIETINITIIAGDSSYSAAKKLQKEGIISSAAEFDEYLCRNGYDKYLVIGNHKIPKNASMEEIAKIITGKKRK